jgi:primosomal protein N' (replication factor Y)
VLVARVLPDVTGLDKEFDYLVPAELAGDVAVGSLVRVPLHGRRVGGWIVGLGVDLHVDADRLRPIAKVSSLGPAPATIDLARWASVRWAPGRLRPFMVAASPPAMVAGLGPARRTERHAHPVSAAAAELFSGTGGMLRLGPNDDVVPVIAAAASAGPALVIEPSVDGAALDAARLRRAGLHVAVIPAEWPAAASGVDVVIGARAAVWAPCPGLAAIVVVDEHDESLQEERTPTWHARDVALERARRAGVPIVLTSPCPTLTGAEAITAAGGSIVRPSIDAERASWPIVELVDRSREEPWRTSLVTSPLIAHLRQPGRTVVCVHNLPGRARILACRHCRSLARCERCEAAVGLADDGALTCARCGRRRPPVCAVCGASAFANLRPGVTRLREELEAAAGRPVVAVTGADEDPPPAAEVYVGTEAVLHRVPRADVVAFLDLDRELLAPRYRAAEQAMALLVRGARLVGARAGGGRVLVQTFLPHHEVLRAAVLADPGRLLAAEHERRQLLGLPPFAALAEVSGAGSDEWVDALRAVPGIAVGARTGGYLVRAATWEALSEALLHTPRPARSRVRVAVDPPRR